MANSSVIGMNEKLGQTYRSDAWWVEPVLTVLALGLFSIYAFWRAAQNNYYEWGPYLSPFYSPDLRALFPEMMRWVAFSPAFLVLWAPLGFRASCYFYRRAYYRSFFMDPPACAVGEAMPHNYQGEKGLPFVLSNLHRYFLYLAIILTLFHWTHVAHSFDFNGHFGVGTGSLVITLDALLLTLYVFSCHSWRHLVGGKLNCFSCSKFNQIRYKGWVRVSKLNENHMLWAWLSLASVGFADFYVYMVSSGVFHDVRFF